MKYFIVNFRKAVQLTHGNIIPYEDLNEEEKLILLNLSRCPVELENLCVESSKKLTKYIYFFHFYSNYNL